MTPELHLVVIWNRAVRMERELLAEMSSCVKVVARLWVLRAKRIVCALTGRKPRGGRHLRHYSAVVSKWRFT